MCRNLKNLFVIVALLTPFAALAINDMYQWVDEKGITHYTQTPPLNRPYKVIKGKETSQSSSRSLSQTQRSSTPPSQKTAPRTEVDRYKAARNKNCEVAKRNLNTLKNVARIRITGDDGEERLLTDQEKAEKIKLSQEQVKNFCSKNFNKSAELFPDPNDPDAPRQN